MALAVVWLRRLLSVLDVLLNHLPLFTRTISQSICIAQNLLFQKRTKYIGIKYHFVLEQENKYYCVFVKMENMLADLLTKRLNRVRFEGIRSRLGMSEYQSHCTTASEKECWKV